MSAQHTPTNQHIKQKISERTAELLAEFPESADWIESYEATHAAYSTAPRNTVVQQVADILTEHHSAAEYVQQISHEEFSVVIDKLQQCITDNPAERSSDALAYLQQQLSDLLGFPVLTELQDRTVPHMVGTITAGKHLRRFPQDSATQHDQYPAAGMQLQRSYFGWLAPAASISEELRAMEQYWVGLALADLPDWQTHPERQHWWKHRKVLLICPSAQTFVVAAVEDAIVGTVQQQLIGSPEILHSLRCWTPGYTGTVLVFLIDDPNNTVPVGPIPIASSIGI